MQNEKIIIVGGGITGLAAAYILSKTHQNITIVEGSEQVGGLLSTFTVGGNQLEYFYHHFFKQDTEINWLVKELGIEDQLVFRKTKMGIFRNGTIYNFNGTADILRFKPLNLIGKARFAATSLFLGKFAQWRNYESTAALEWFYKYGGKNLTSAIWKPLLNIKFGPYASKIPLAWMIGRLRQRMSSRENNDEYLGYLDGSLNTLLTALVAKLKENKVEILTNANVQELIIENNSIKGIKTKDQTLNADQVLLTIPSPAIQQMLQPKHQQLAEKIGVVKYFGAICTVLELDRKLSDIYWLNIADEGYPFGGIIEHTNFITANNYQGKHLVYLSRYFSKEEEIASMSTDQIKEMMIAPLAKIYKGFQKNWIQHVRVFKTNTAATVCDLNFSKKVVDVKLPIENLYLANMMHVYPDERSVNNSIRIAAEAAKVMGFPADFVPNGHSLSGKIGF